MSGGADATITTTRKKAQLKLKFNRENSEQKQATGFVGPRVQVKPAWTGSPSARDDRAGLPLKQARLLVGGNSPSDLQTANCWFTRNR